MRYYLRFFFLNSLILFSFYRNYTHETHEQEKRAPAYWYNRGHDFYHQKKYVHALICWKNIPKNIRYHDYITVQKHIADAYKELNYSPAVPWYTSLVRFLQKIVWWLSFLGTQLVILFLWGLACFIFTAYHTRLLRMLSTFIILICLVLGIGLRYDYYDTWDSSSYALVAEKNVPLYLVASTHSHIVGHCTQADTLVTLEKRPGWYKVALAHGLKGWAQDIHLIRTDSLSDPVDSHVSL